jgi:hypothetical protein
MRIVAPCMAAIWCASIFSRLFAAWIVSAASMGEAYEARKEQGGTVADLQALAASGSARSMIKARVTRRGRGRPRRDYSRDPDLQSLSLRSRFKQHWTCPNA